MRRIVLNVVLGLSLAALAAVNWFAQRDYLQPNDRIMPDMADAVPYETFAPNPVFPDGKTLQQPPAGTIARGMMPLPYEATPEDADRAGRELTNPFDPNDAAARERGAVIFRRICLPCHGATGTGDGPVARRGFPPPPSLLTEQARALPDGRIFHIVTYGQGNMPAHAAQTTVEDRWRAVLRVRELQRSAAAPAAATGAP